LTTREPTLTLQPTSLSDDCNAVRVAEAELLSSRLECDDITPAYSGYLKQLAHSGDVKAFRWRLRWTPRLWPGPVRRRCGCRSGPFVLGIVGNDGQILSPARAPNSVLFAARQQGQGKIDTIATTRGMRRVPPQYSSLCIISRRSHVLTQGSIQNQLDGSNKT